VISEYLARNNKDPAGWIIKIIIKRIIKPFKNHLILKVEPVIYKARMFRKPVPFRRVCNNSLQIASEKSFF